VVPFSFEEKKRRELISLKEAKEEKGPLLQRRRKAQKKERWPLCSRWGKKKKGEAFLTRTSGKKDGGQFTWLV